MIKSNGRTRHGLHRQDKVNFGAMVTPEFKAIAQLTANKLECTMVELMQQGIENSATKAGILKNGSVAQEHRDAVSALTDIICCSLAAKRKES